MDELTEIINAWDPTNLMLHAPDDEYNLEIKMIEELLKTTSSEEELAKGIPNIFLETCGDECITIARKILKEYREHINP
ncbi:DUF1871 family protein [Pelosinus sp. UFO1]|uniref:DUF1871 family protein n=1 Tax=Pelosinus sp. UFO1 TaxID=484770 RepID=UPI0004D0FE67|nr:DUF1871 family protein [Pelosinus sp. UFO1]AIF51661.1 protein of unknown function DUF1871 [Pelosinus sp. UFO1]